MLWHIHANDYVQLSNQLVIMLIIMHSTGSLLNNLTKSLHAKWLNVIFYTCLKWIKISIVFFFSSSQWHALSTNYSTNSKKCNCDVSNLMQYITLYCWNWYNAYRKKVQHCAFLLIVIKILAIVYVRKYLQNTLLQHAEHIDCVNNDTRTCDTMHWHVHWHSDLYLRDTEMHLLLCKC